MKKLARSGSLIVEELFGIKSSIKQELDPAEVAYAGAFNGKLELDRLMDDRMKVFEQRKHRPQ